MTIRKARESDLQAMAELCRQLNPADPRPPEEKLNEAWGAMLANPGMHCLVAEVEGRAVSTCTMTIVPNLTRNARPYAFIENVVTLESHRKRGIGSAVMKAALDVAWGAGCYKVMLMTGSVRQGIHHFYEQAGFDRQEKIAFVARPPAGWRKS
jgi:GNAT superfamily N-acetyltransferase